MNKLILIIGILLVFSPILPVSAKSPYTIRSSFDLPAGYVIPAFQPSQGSYATPLYVTSTNTIFAPATGPNDYSNTFVLALSGSGLLLASPVMVHETATDFAQALIYNSANSRILLTSSLCNANYACKYRMVAIDSTTYKVVANFTVPGLVAAYDSHSNELYVASCVYQSFGCPYSSPFINVYNAATNAFVKSISIGHTVSALLYDPSNHNIYAASASYVYVIDDSTNSVGSKISSLGNPGYNYLYLDVTHGILFDYTTSSVASECPAFKSFGTSTNQLLVASPDDTPLNGYANPGNVGYGNYIFSTTDNCYGADGFAPETRQLSVTATKIDRNSIPMPPLSNSGDGYNEACSGATFSSTALGVNLQGACVTTASNIYTCNYNNKGSYPCQWGAPHMDVMNPSTGELVARITDHKDSSGNYVNFQAFGYSEGASVMYAWGTTFYSIIYEISA